MTAKKEIAFCPECDSRLRLRTVRLGQRITCRECDTALEVVELNPIELDWAFEEPLEEEEYEPRYRSKEDTEDFSSEFEY